jgi:hypothetical protein
MISMSLLIVGAVAYVLAWFLPTIEHREDFLGVKKVTVYYGWYAFWFALRSEGFSFSRLLSTGSALTNLILVAALVDVSTAAGGPHRVLQVALVACAVLNTHWWFRADDLRIGYYWWAGSFFLIAAGLATRGGFASRMSAEQAFQAALVAISATAVLAGLYVEGIRPPSHVAREGIASGGETTSHSTASSPEPNVPREEGEPYSSGAHTRRGSYWLLAGGIAAAALAWFLTSETPRTPIARHAPAQKPRTPHPGAVPSLPVKRPTSHGDSPARQPETTPLPAPPTPGPSAASTETTSPAIAALRQQARDLRRSIEPFLYDASARDAAFAAEKSLAQGEDLLQRGDAKSAVALFRDASRKLQAVRASANRNLGEQRVAQVSSWNAAAARGRFTRDQATKYAESSYERGQQLEANAEAAYRSRDYRSASSLYAAARGEYDNVLETVTASLLAEDELRAKHDQEAREAAGRLKEEHDRELARRKKQEQEQTLREQNALRAKANGKIHKVRVNLVTYGGGQNLELEILIDFSVIGMKGLDGVVVVFLYAQQVGGLFDRAKTPFEPLKGSGSDSNGVYAYEKITPGYQNSHYPKLRIAIRTSRFTLPRGTNRIRAAVYLRTGGGGELERDLDATSEDITLSQP